jgi:hypothetical protein
LEMIRILEGASASLKMNGAPFIFGGPNGSTAVSAPIRDGAAHSLEPKRTRREVSRARDRMAAVFEDA